MNLTTTQKIKELLEYYSSDILCYNMNIAESDLYSPDNEYTKLAIDTFFEKHINIHAIDIPISKILNYKDSCILIDTPDGFNLINTFFIKNKRQCHYILAENNISLNCSFDTLIETKGKWVYANTLKIGDIVLTKDGYSKIKENSLTSILDTYDFNIVHANHRYWGGTGISVHNSGKTYLALNYVKSAITELGYYVYYIDTEGALDPNDEAWTSFGIHNTALPDDQQMYKHIRTIKTFSQLRYFLNTLTDQINDANAVCATEGGDPLKVMIVVDSYGMLNTDKEVNDAKKGKTAADMGLRAKEGRQLFRNITLDLSNLGIPFIFLNHTGATLDLFSYEKEIPVGGEGPTFSASFIFLLGKKPLTNEDADGKKVKTGIIVKSRTLKNRKVIPNEVYFHISHKGGANRYVFLENYLGWDKCGITRGTIYTEEEFLKKWKKGVATNSTGKALTTYEFTKKKQKYYCVESDTAKTWAVMDTCQNVPIAKLYTSEVFTEGSLRMMDEKVIKPLYNYKSLAELLEEEHAGLTSELIPETIEPSKADFDLTAAIPKIAENQEAE